MGANNLPNTEPIRILAGMVVAGDQQYFDFASYAIPSFLKNCPSADLIVYTDNPDELATGGYHTSNITVRTLEMAVNSDPEIMKPILDKVSEGMMNKNTGGRVHDQRHIACLPAFLQKHAERYNYTYCARLDVDAYYAGGDFLKVLVKEIKDIMHMKDMFMVERIHPAMIAFDMSGIPGAGFTFWRTSGKFGEFFQKKFKGNEQNTIWSCLKDGQLRTARLLRPGYHLVYPFRKNPKLTKADLEQFLPAYIHLGGSNILANQIKLKGWFE